MPQETKNKRSCICNMIFWHITLLKYDYTKKILYSVIIAYFEYDDKGLCVWLMQYYCILF